MFIEGESRPVHLGTSVSNPGCGTWSEFDTEDVKNHLWEYFPACIEELWDDSTKKPFQDFVVNAVFEECCSPFICRCSGLLSLRDPCNHYGSFLFSQFSQKNQGLVNVTVERTHVPSVKPEQEVVLFSLLSVEQSWYFNDKLKKQLSSKTKLKDGFILTVILARQDL